LLTWFVLAQVAVAAQLRLVARVVAGAAFLGEITFQ
jgi:hypothetical protein